MYNFNDDYAVVSLGFYYFLSTTYNNQNLAVANNKGCKAQLCRKKV